jgi:flagellar biosynthesis chaperone FliJ
MNFKILKKNLNAKASKARMLAYLEKYLEEYDDMILRNIGNEVAVKSLQEQYKKLIATLTEIRDTPTTD